VTLAFIVAAWLDAANRLGQDDSALIVTPEGRQVLVDGNPNADSEIQALSKTIPLVIAALIWWC
jgi:hypothetical protein